MILTDGYAAAFCFLNVGIVFRKALDDDCAVKSMFVRIAQSRAFKLLQDLRLFGPLIAEREQHIELIVIVVTFLTEFVHKDYERILWTGHAFQFIFHLFHSSFSICVNALNLTDFTRFIQGDPDGWVDIDVELIDRDRSCNCRDRQDADN